MDKNKQKYKYLYLLSEKYPNRQSVVTELIRLKAILNLARPTEHFMSDLHGEYESFFHILNNCYGVIKEKVDYLFSEEMSTSQKAEFCTLIYYPKEKILNLKKQKLITTQWYSQNLIYLLRLSRLMSYKYPQSELKNLLPKGYETIILELLTARPNDDTFQEVYFNTILNTLININSGTDFIIAFTKFIKKLAVAHLHIVGDIYDRGQRPECRDRHRTAAGRRLHGRPRKRWRGMRGSAGKGCERNLPADPYGYPDAGDERLRCGKKDTADGRPSKGRHPHHRYDCKCLLRR